MHQSQSIVSNLIDELNALLVRRVVDTPLQYAAAVTVSSNLDAIGSNSIVNELNGKFRDRSCALFQTSYLVVLRSQLIQTFLDYMISVEIFDENNHV